jgi:hypothetical protein
MRRKPWIAAGVFAAAAFVALLVVRPGVLTGEAGGAGCEAVENFADAELAREEARYLVMEVMVGLALGLDQVDRYIALAEPLLADAASIETANQQNCYRSELLPTTQNQPKVRVDFQSCPQESGRLDVGLAVGLPEGVDPNTLPPEVREQVADLPPGAQAFDLTMVGTKSNGIPLEGNMRLVEAGGSQTVEGRLQYSFLDYSGDLALEGTIEGTEAARSVTMTGTFESSGSLHWTLEGSNLTVVDGCRGLKAGRMVGRYDGGAQGAVDVVASFDGSCDGCAKITVDGVEKPNICIPDMVQLP